MLSPKQQEQITNAIGKVVTFYSQPNSIEIDGINISWEIDPRSEGGFYDFFGYSHGSIEIKYQEDFSKTNKDTLASFSSHFSNFDSTQSFFDILEKRDKLEKENQELKIKQGLQAYGITNDWKRYEPLWKHNKIL